MSLRTRLAVALAAASLGCGKDKAPPSESFAGTWNATRVEFVSTADPATRVDIVAQGSKVTVVLDARGTYTTTTRAPGLPDDVSTGTWSASSDVITMQETGVPWSQQFSYALAGNTLTLTGADAEFDFDDDGTGEPAKLNVTLTR